MAARLHGGDCPSIGKKGTEGDRQKIQILLLATGMFLSSSFVLEKETKIEDEAKGARTPTSASLHCLK